MVFVTVDSCRTHQEEFTKLLLATFPGSVVYQHLTINHVSHDVLHNKVDAVFVEAELQQVNGLPLIQMLRKQKPDLPVFIISKTNRSHDTVTETEANGYFVLPDHEQQLLEAIRLLKNKENAL
ncbi:MAG: response regulator [Peptococcaceae bacterium]|nr:response regulator [Peptococcaceae bacterium]